AAQQIESAWSRSRAVRQMPSLLPPDCLPATLELARAMTSPNLRARTLMAAALASPPGDRPALLADASEAIHTIPALADRASPLSVLASRLADPAQATAAAEEALAGASQSADESERGWTIVDLMPHLPFGAR